MYQHCPFILAITGFLVIVVGIISAWYAIPKLEERGISEAIALREGNDVFNMWKKPPFPLQFKLYFFNVTNTFEVQNGAEPLLTEMGPYVYDEYLERTNVTINEETDTIRYFLRKTFFFNQKASGCRRESDLVTIVNAGIVSTALQVEIMLPTAISTVSDAMPYFFPGVKDIFLRGTVRDILFDGMPMYCGAPEIEFICGAMRATIPPTMRLAENGEDYLVAMFHHLNGTDRGPYEIGRGLKNTTRAEIETYDGESTIGKWNGDSCNMINGTDATIFAPISKPPPDRLYVYSPDICRSLYLNFENETETLGISALRYSIKAESLADNAENRCFCPLVKDENYEDVIQCPPSGLMQIMNCVKAPLLTSYPHFYFTNDKTLLKYAKGLNPQRELHESYVELEPKSGTPLSGRIRIQMNVHVKPFDDFVLLNNVTEGVFPIAWIEEGVDVPPNIAVMLDSSLAKLRMLHSIKWIIIVTGILIMISSFVLIMYKERLMCFSNCSNGKLSINVPKKVARTGVISVASDTNFNSTVLYPALYPQIYDKNVNDGLSHRSNGNNSQLAWQEKD